MEFLAPCTRVDDLKCMLKISKQRRGAYVQVPCHLALIACTTVLEQPVHKGFEILCLALPHLYTHSLSDNEISQAFLLRIYIL